MSGSAAGGGRLEEAAIDCLIAIIGGIFGLDGDQNLLGRDFVPHVEGKGLLARRGVEGVGALRGLAAGDATRRGG